MLTATLTKATLQRTSLLSALQLAASIIPSKPSKPVMGFVLIEISNETLTVTATNGEETIRVTRPERVCSPNFKLLAGPRKLIEVLSLTTADFVELGSDGTRIVIQVDRSKFTLATADPCDFPIPELFGTEGLTPIKVPSGVLKTAIKRTIFATDPTSPKYALGGVLFHLAAGKLVAVSTDSRRLPVMPISNQVEERSTLKPVIKQSTLRLLDKCLSDIASTEIQLSFDRIPDSGCVFIQTPSVLILSHLICGAFPKYEAVIPKSHDMSVSVQAADLLSGLKQAVICTTEDSRGVALHFTRGELQLRTNSKEAGESTVAVPISYDGDETKIRCDPRYLLDFVKVLPTETLVEFKINDSEEPLLLTTQDGYLYVVMPLLSDD